MPKFAKKAKKFRGDRGRHTRRILVLVVTNNEIFIPNGSNLELSELVTAMGCSFF